jgi:hypothetical protein
MSPNNIPIEFFIQHHDKFPKPLCNDLNDQLEKSTIIAELLNFSLVKRDGDFLYMHRLVQEIVRKLSNDGIKDWLHICIKAMIKSLPEYEDYSRKGAHEWFECIALHVAAVVDCGIRMLYLSKKKFWVGNTRQQLKRTFVSGLFT